jgi:hypothetical protein
VLRVVPFRLDTMSLRPPSNDEFGSCPATWQQNYSMQQLTLLMSR